MENKKTWMLILAGLVLLAAGCSAADAQVEGTGMAGPTGGSPHRRRRAAHHSGQRQNAPREQRGCALRRAVGRPVSSPTRRWRHLTPRKRRCRAPQRTTDRPGAHLLLHLTGRAKQRSGGAVRDPTRNEPRKRVRSIGWFRRLESCWIPGGVGGSHTPPARSWAANRRGNVVARVTPLLPIFHSIQIEQQHANTGKVVMPHQLGPMIFQPWLDCSLGVKLVARRIERGKWLATGQ